MNQDEADEIQHSKLVITPEMIEAGAVALCELDLGRSISLAEARELTRLVLKAALSR